MNTINVYKGNTATISITVKSKDGEVFNLTGYEMTFTIKKKKTDLNHIIKKTSVITDPTTGVGTTALLRADTDKLVGEYWYEVRIFNSSTSDEKTVLLDKFNILQDLV